MENNNEEQFKENQVKFEELKSDKSSFGIKRLDFFGYRSPASIELIPDSKMAKLQRNIEEHLDYNESCRARGIKKAGEHRAMGPYTLKR